MEITFKDALDYAIKLQTAGSLNEAEKIYDELLTYAPKHIDLLHLKGVLFNQKKEFKKAIETINKAIELIPTDAALHPAFSTFYQNLGNAYQQNSQNDMAEASYKKALELDRMNINAKFNYSRLMSKMKKHSEALRLLDEIIEDDSNYANAITQKADVLLEIGRVDDAILLYSKRLEMEKFHLDSKIGLAKCYFQIGDTQNAYDNFLDATKLGTDLYEPYYWLGVLSESMGDKNKAREYYETAIYIKPNYDLAKMKLLNL